MCPQITCLWGCIVILIALVCLGINYQEYTQNRNLSNNPCSGILRWRWRKTIWKSGNSQPASDGKPVMENLWDSEIMQKDKSVKDGKVEICNSSCCCTCTCVPLRLQLPDLSCWRHNMRYIFQIWYISFFGVPDICQCWWPPCQRDFTVGDL